MTTPYIGPLPKPHEKSIVHKQISKHGYGEVGLQIISPDYTRTNPDSISLTLGLQSDESVVIEDVKKEDVGVYSFQLGPQYTSEVGSIELLWEYTIGDLELRFEDRVQITEPMPLYDSLSDGEKSIVEQVNWLIGDLFDSGEGGPFLAENFQSHFNYERIAQLMTRAMVKFNTIGQPLTRYGVAIMGGEALPSQYYGLVASLTYLEVLRHLIRSYVEIPNFGNMGGITYTDRRDYLQRWQSVLAEEKPELEKSVRLAKRTLLGLGRGALLVSGGIYGGSTRFFTSGMYTASQRSMRFYPAAPAIGGYYR